MSSLEVYQIAKDGVVRHLGDAGCAPAGWMHFWSAVSMRVFGERMGFDDESCQRVWRLFGSDRLTVTENILMGASFDRAWVRRGGIDELIWALHDWWPDNCRIGGHMVRPTLLEVVGILRCVAHDALGVCFNGTSVNSNPWRVREGEEGETRPFRFGTDTHLVDGGEPWEVFEALKERGLKTRWDLRHGLVGVREPNALQSAVSP